MHEPLQQREITVVTFIDKNAKEEVRQFPSNAVVAIAEAKSYYRGGKNLDLALHKTNDLLSPPQNNAGAGFWTWDVGTDTYEWSDELFHIFGLDPSTPQSSLKTWRSWLHPDDLQDSARKIHEAIRDHKQLVMEFRIVRPDGEIRWCQEYGTTTYDENGAPLRIFGFTIDTTDKKLDKEKLRLSEEYWKFALEGAGDGVWDWQAPDNMTFSKRWKEILGYGEDEVRNTTNEWISRTHPDDLPGTLQSQQDVQEGKITKVVDEFRMSCKDGSWKWLLSRGMVITQDDNGKPLRIVGTIADITERKRVEHSLRQSEELWKFALEGAGDAVWDWDVQTNRIKNSARWQEMLGYTADEGVDALDDLTSRIHPEDFPVAKANGEALLEGITKSTSIELRMRCKDGGWKWMLSRGMVVSRDDSGRPLRIVGTIADITLLKEHQRKLEHIAHYDALTNLPNRMLLGFRLQQSMAHGQRRNQSLAVAYLDLDGFKVVNDRYGHGVGDELLVLVAQRMKAALRECDTLARIGGDEFVAVLADLDRFQDCEPVLERLLQAAAAPAKVGEIDLQVSVSIGVTLYPKDGVDADQLMRHADQAMYQAKQAGRNRYHLFDVEHDAAVQIQRESIEHIRSALDRREFVLHYQPKVNMQSGALVGVEALIRWQHPERGLLPPDAFLPVIVDQQISVSLGEWVIDTALTQMEEWLAVGLDFPVSVNISAHHLQQDNFEARLAELLDAHPGVNPAHLELEILETSAFEDVMHITKVMHACRAFGVTFALDDFGTGYSSLTYLRRLPIELLKIDQSFVRDMLDDPDDLAIVEGVVGLALAFRRKVIAEGVETVAHGELLLQLGCELAQGYGIARPMPAEELPVWAASWRPDASWMAWRDRPRNRENLV